MGHIAEIIAQNQEIIMSKLDNSQRNSLPDGKFALPAERKYPVDTPGRAQNAKARASEMEHKGVISASTKEKIDSKADRALGHWSKK